MCGGVKYSDKSGKDWTIYFPSPKAALPVLKRDGDIEWVTWGKRKEEEDRFFAPGGWARLDSINEGKWKRFHPRPVLLPVQSFMEKDHDRKSHWFDVQPGQVVQGLLAQHENVARVYVVTTDTPDEYHYILFRRLDQHLWHANSSQLGQPDPASLMDRGRLMAYVVF